ncbi:MAG: DUF4157 domain-containing protein [Aureispira sp.]
MIYSKGEEAEQTKTPGAISQTAAGEETSSTHPPHKTGKGNQTGIPPTMKAGFEYSWGISLNSVQVHYNSKVPESVLGEGAKVYTEDTNIYLAQGSAGQLPKALTQIAKRLQASPPKDELENGKRKALRKQSRKDGLPLALKTGIEAETGYNMDEVRVHKNSKLPAEMGALAYAEGKDIYVGQGEEQHIPHEAWHVVQQAKGGVSPTCKISGEGVNTEGALEAEAEAEGKAAEERGKALGARSPLRPLRRLPKRGTVKQLKTKISHVGEIYKVPGTATEGKVGRKMECLLDPANPLEGTPTPTKDTALYTHFNITAKGYEKGHLLSAKLGGLGTEENLYPISKRANGMHEREVERWVKHRIYALTNALRGEGEKGKDEKIGAGRGREIEEQAQTRQKKEIEACKVAYKVEIEGPPSKAEITCKAQAVGPLFLKPERIKKRIKSSIPEQAGEAVEGTPKMQQHTYIPATGDNPQWNGTGGRGRAEPDREFTEMEKAHFEVPGPTTNVQGAPTPADKQEGAGEANLLLAVKQMAADLLKEKAAERGDEGTPGGPAWLTERGLEARALEEGVQVEVRALSARGKLLELAKKYSTRKTYKRAIRNRLLKRYNAVYRNYAPARGLTACGKLGGEAEALIISRISAQAARARSQQLGTDKAIRRNMDATIKEYTQKVKNTINKALMAGEPYDVVAGHTFRYIQGIKLKARKPQKTRGETTTNLSKRKPNRGNEGKDTKTYKKKSIGRK